MKKFINKQGLSGHLKCKHPSNTKTDASSAAFSFKGSRQKNVGKEVKDIMSKLVEETVKGDERTEGYV